MRSERSAEGARGTLPTKRCTSRFRAIEYADEDCMEDVNKHKFKIPDDTALKRRNIPKPAQSRNVTGQSNFAK